MAVRDRLKQRWKINGRPAAYAEVVSLFARLIEERRDAEEPEQTVKE